MIDNSYKASQDRYAEGKMTYRGTLVAWIALKKAVLRFVMRSTMG